MSFFARISAYLRSLSGPRPTDTPTNPRDFVPAITRRTLFVNSEIGLRLRWTPEVRADNVLGILAYGTEVFVLNTEEKWADVESAGLRGWLSSFYLSDTKPVLALVMPVSEDAADLLPRFQIGVANRATDLNTIKLRKIISDEFGGGRNGWDLQCTEYVQYRVWRAGVALRWPPDRPRDGGKWAGIFERNGYYAGGREPRAGAAMSLLSGFSTPAANAVGHVFYVETVFDNGSIKVSEAN